MKTIKVRDPETREVVTISVPDNYDSLPDDQKRQAAREALSVVRQSASPQPAPARQITGGRMEEISVRDPETGQPVTLAVPEGFRQFPVEQQRDVARAALAQARQGGYTPFVRPEDVSGMREVADQNYQDWLATVPEGAAIHGADGVTTYPHSGVRYTRDRPGWGEEEQLQAAQAGRIRDRNAGAYGFGPAAAGYMTGASYGMADEALGAIDPVAREALRQSYEQAQADAPWTTGGSEVLGALGTAYATRGAAPRATAAVDSALMGGSRARNILASGAAAMAGNSAYEFAAARPGERLDRATDPAALGISGGLGGAIGGVVRPYGMRGQSDVLALPPPDDFRALPSPEMAAQGRGVRPFTMVEEGAVPPVPEAPRAQASTEIADYLRSIDPAVSGNQLVDDTAAAVRLGVDVPRGVIDEAYRPRLERSFGSLIARPSAVRAMGSSDASLGDAANRIAADIGEARPGGSLPDLTTEVRNTLETRRDQTRTGYDELFADQQLYSGVYPASEETQGILNNIMKLRGMAGARTNRQGQVTDVRGIEEAYRLLRSDNLTVEGLRRARSEMTTAIEDARRKAIPSPRIRDMERVRDALTDEIRTGINIAHGDNTEAAEAAVNRLTELDRNYRVVNDELRDYEGMLEGVNARALDTVQKAFASGGETAINDLKRLRENAPTQWGNVLALTVDRAGRNSAGDFDATTFARNWNRLSGDAKQAMFAPGHLRDLDDIARLTQRMGEVNPEASTVGRNLEGVIGAVGLVTPGIGLEAIALGTGAVKLLGARAGRTPANAKHLKTYLENMERAQRSEGAAQRVALQRALRAIKRVRDPASNLAVGGGTGTAMGLGVAELTDQIEALLAGGNDQQQVEQPAPSVEAPQ